MASINVRPASGNLYFDFRYLGVRCREQTALPDSPANRSKLQKILDRIEAEITLGQFEYARYFPNSHMLEKFDRPLRHFRNEVTPVFREFARQWLDEMAVQWRVSYHESVSNTLKKHILPQFGEKEVGRITKSEVLAFRSALAKAPGLSAKSTLSADRINHIMTHLRMILDEAADRFEFTPPCRGIKSLKVPRTHVEPFTLDEVRQIIDAVRSDYRSYYVVRFFTAMRSSEIHGLKWKYVDFDNRAILVRETLVNGRTEYTKTDGSQREIEMSEPVYQALKAQHEVTASLSDYVFCTRSGSPLSNTNVTKRVWYPLLRHLDLKPRRPYQSRHTAATLWLAAGENPNWIANQMGHTTTMMLFRVYSRYVPNMTRRDGSAMNRLLISSGMVEVRDA